MGILASIEQKYNIDLFVNDNTFFFVSSQNINLVYHNGQRDSITSVYYIASI